MIPENKYDNRPNICHVDKISIKLDKLFNGISYSILSTSIASNLKRDFTYTYGILVLVTDNILSSGRSIYTKVRIYL